MGHAVGGQDKPELALKAIKAALEQDAVVLETLRGDVAETVPALLAEVGGARAS